MHSTGRQQQALTPRPDTAGPAVPMRLRLAIDDVASLDTLADGVAVLREGRLLHLNAWLAAALGGSPEGLLGRELAGFVREEDRPALVERDAALAAGGSVAQLSFRLEARPEPLAIHDTLASCELDGERCTVHLLVDTSGEARAQRSAQEMEARLRQLVEQLPMPMFEVGVDGRIISANAQAVHAFGLAREELERGVWVVEVVEPDSRERLQQAVRCCLRGEPPGAEEYVVLRRDGTTFPVIGYTHRIERGGEAVGVRVVLVDITERKRMEAELREVNEQLEARVRERTRELQASNARLLAEIDERGRVERSLRESEQRYRSLFDSAGDLVFSLDRDGTLRAVNPAFEQLTGWTRSQWLGRHFSTLVYEDDAAAAMALLEACLRGEAVAPREIRLPCGDGERRAVEVSAAPLRADGALIGVLGVGRDVTERSRNSETLIRAERLAAVGTLAAGVAHEFNNLNAAILGFTNLALERTDLDATLRDWLGRIRKSAQRSNTVAQSLLAFCAPPAPPRAIGNLVLMVRETLALAARQLEDIGAEVKLELAPVPDIRLDPAGITQTILQLVINAVHAMVGRPVRRLTVSTGREGQRLFVRVADTGCGIPPENLSRLFTPFFTTKGARAGSFPQAAMSGTGLGLCICHTVVESHGGEITVSTVVNEGTSFTVWLPLTRPDAAD